MPPSRRGRKDQPPTPEDVLSVTDEDPQDAPPEITTTEGEPPSTPRGTVHVRTQTGHAFRSHNDALPLIDSVGVRLTRGEADEVLAEARDGGLGDRYVVEVEPQDSEA